MDSEPWAGKSADQILMDIDALFAAMHASLEPTAIFIPRRRWIWLHRIGMSKRQFRRWRGKVKEWRRA